MTLSKFISEISVEDSVAFQNEWNSIKKKKDKIYISYDSTNKNCQAMYAKIKSGRCDRATESGESDALGGEDE